MVIFDIIDLKHIIDLIDVKVVEREERGQTSTVQCTQSLGTPLSLL